MNDDLHSTSLMVMRNAIPLMEKYNLPVIPRNYAVFYNYVTGENSALREAFDNHLLTHDEITTELCEKWFMDYVCFEDEMALSEAQNEMKSILENVFNMIGNVNGRNDEYDKVLASQEALLNKKPSLDTLLDMISILREETGSMRESSEKMRNDLNNKLGEVNQLRHSIENIRHEASIDYLTDIANRKGLMEALPLLCGNKSEKQCFAMIDIDYFKKFNDTFGHLIGDKVLRFVANIIKDSIKGSDFIARYGGEEFVVVFADTERDNAFHAAENIRIAIEKTRFILKKEKQDLGTISVSIGLSQYRHGESYEDCIGRADKALYQAKDNGRNCVVADEVVG